MAECNQSIKDISVYILMDIRFIISYTDVGSTIPIKNKVLNIGAKPEMVLICKRMFVAVQNGF